MNELNLTDMAIELLLITKDFPFRMKKKDTKISDFELYDFEQVWGSTSLGLGRIGGCAMTSARTYVLVPINGNEDTCYVYFAGKFAYSVPYSKTFMNDVQERNVAGKWDIEKYL